MIFVNNIISETMSNIVHVEHEGNTLRLTVPNMINRYRADTFSTKEPETLAWIDDIPRDSIFWDVGANVGLYSCYAAVGRNCTVYAFEPSVFNLELLSRNVFINDMADRVTIIPLPLTSDITSSQLNMTTTEWGGALSTFGESYGDDGNEMEAVFRFTTLGISADKVAAVWGIPMPQYLKIDVDGIEHLILEGAQDVLKEVASVLVEVNDDFRMQSERVSKLLKNLGLVMKEKTHAPMFDDNARFGNTYNQIWVRE